MAYWTRPAFALYQVDDEDGEQKAACVNAILRSIAPYGPHIAAGGHVLWLEGYPLERDVSNYLEIGI